MKTSTVKKIDQYIELLPKLGSLEIAIHVNKESKSEILELKEIKSLDKADKQGID